jgi:hypothetical protein
MIFNVLPSHSTRYAALGAPLAEQRSVVEARREFRNYELSPNALITQPKKYFLLAGRFFTMFT